VSPARPDGAVSLKSAPMTDVPLHTLRGSLTTPFAFKPALTGRPVNGRRPRQRLAGRVTVDGKFFAAGGQRFPLHAVSYGTFAPRATDGAQFPDNPTLERDVMAMAEAGFTAVRTYTAPTDDLLAAAKAHDLRVLAGAFYPDWRYILGAGKREQRAMVRDAQAEVRRQAERLAGRDEVLAMVIGNEVPADAVRWFGSKRIAGTLGRLVDTVHEVDPDMLVTYANYPSSEYLDVPGVDFLTFNVFLEDQEDLRRYLTRLHHIAGDRPLMLGEIGLHTAGDLQSDEHQAAVVDWQLATALERGVGGTCLFSWTDDWWVGGAPVEGWHFGLTRHDRTPRPVLATVAQWNKRTVGDLDYPWPRISVAICAYNSADTLEECLRETCKLDYPNLEILVVDDGSTDATAGIAYRHPKVKLVSIEHGGLSVARNACIEASTGDLIAYLDSDAYPTPEWPYYLALGMDGPRVGGVGGPNVPPRADPAGAHRVAASPGGPVHVLVADDRAEHVPGCNMAFWRPVLEEVGGFDPVYTAAGDDVDVCWKVLDRGWEIGFHPAALVWHHRRPTVKAYLRQQRGYGKAEALVAARHPDRFTGLGTARWRGRIYTSVAQSIRHQRIYRGAFAGAAYQSVYRGGGHVLDLAHQIGVPLALAAGVASIAVGAFVWSPAVLVALAVVAVLAGLAAYDGATATPPRAANTGTAFRFRASVGLLHLLQPLARWWGRWRHRLAAYQDMPKAVDLPATVGKTKRGIVTLHSDQPRPVLAAGIVDVLRRAGVVVLPVTGWEDHDGHVVGSLLLSGQLLSTAHMEGTTQVRVRRKPRWRLVGAVALGALAASVVSPWTAAALAAVAAVDLTWGLYRIGPRIRRILGATR
jgi:glycosyltransferase involved in cell wall biosynthesis